VKRVITYGTFDLLHYGHINILQKARNLGDYLVVGLSTDAFNSVKNKVCYFNYENRKRLIESIRYVDLVIPEDCWEQKIEDVKKYLIDIFVMGDDWEGKFDFLKDFCQVMYLPRTPDISSTKIKEDHGIAKKPEKRSVSEEK
jgi:glycerol-3-phosphate cytidylyltransferase